MKIRDDLILRKVGDTWAVFPIGDALNYYGNIMKLNETGVFLWEKLKNGCSLEELIVAVIREYELDRERASHVVMQFLNSLIEEKILGEAML